MEKDEIMEYCRDEYFIEDYSRYPTVFKEYHTGRIVHRDDIERLAISREQLREIEKENTELGKECNRLRGDKRDSAAQFEAFVKHLKEKTDRIKALTDAINTASNWLVCLGMCSRDEILEEGYRQNEKLEAALKNDC